MKKLFIGILMICLMLSMSGIAIAEEYHSFSTNQIPTIIFSGTFKDIGHGYKATAQGATMLTDIILRMKKGILKPVGETRCASVNRRLAAAFDRHNFREENGVNVCDYTWKKGLFDNEEKNLAKADINHDKKLVKEEIITYWKYIKNEKENEKINPAVLSGNTFCSECGAKVKKDAKFCSKCGKKL